MKTKTDVKVGILRKVREYYETDYVLGGLIKVDRLARTEKFGDELHIYYENISKYDEIFVNGVKFVPENKEK